MASNPKRLSEILEAIVHQDGHTTAVNQLSHECRVLSAVMIQALQQHSPASVASWIRWRIRTSQRPDQRQVTSIDEDELKAQMADVQRVREIGRRKRSERSSLEPFRNELVRLRKQGFSWGDLQAWLRRYPRVSVARSTVIRLVRRWCDEENS